MQESIFHLKWILKIKQKFKQGIAAMWYIKQFHKCDKLLSAQLFTEWLNDIHFFQLYAITDYYYYKKCNLII